MRRKKLAVCGHFLINNNIGYFKYFISERRDAERKIIIHYVPTKVESMKKIAPPGRIKNDWAAKLSSGVIAKILMEVFTSLLVFLQQVKKQKY